MLQQNIKDKFIIGRSIRMVTRFLDKKLLNFLTKENPDL